MSNSYKIEVEVTQIEVEVIQIEVEVTQIDFFQVEIC